MGVSFKVSKTGTRFRPKPLPVPIQSSHDDEIQNSGSQTDLVEAGENITRMPNSSETHSLIAEREASFTLNLFPDGYSIGKPSENDAANQSFPKLLLPYDRSSDTLFLAIESGHLPADILDDIPAKYVDGAIICEVRDYRRDSSEKGAGTVSSESSPTVNKVCLKISLENIVKDIPSITDKSWTYGDLIEVESKILRALQPNLHLDPTPKLDRLCESIHPTKLNLRRKRIRNIQEFAVTSSNKIHGKKVCIDRVQENSNSRLGNSAINTSNAIVQQTLENSAMQNINPSIAMAMRSKNIISDSSISGFSMMPNQSRYAMAVGTPRNLQEHGSISGINSSGASPAAQDVMISYADNPNASVTLVAKRETPDGQLSPLSNIAKRLRSAPSSVDAMQQQQIGSHVDAHQGSDLNWQNTLLQQQAMARGIQYPGGGIQKFPQQVFEGGLNKETGAIQFASGQQGMRLVAKEEQFEIERVDGAGINRTKSEMEMDASNLDPQQLRFQQRMQHNAFMRPNFSQTTTWNNLGQQIEKEAKKEDQLQKRKQVQSPRLSSGALPHSPLSSRSGEFSNGSVGPSFGPSSLTTAPGALQKEKAAMGSLTAAVGTPSLTSSANDSTQRQQQAQLAAKRRSNSVPKTPAMSGVASPASVSTGVPFNANSPSVGTAVFSEQGLQNMFDRFSKIDMVTTRHKLNFKVKNPDHPIKQQNTYAPQHVAAFLANAASNDGVIDESSSLSKSLIGGSMNACKMRVLSFIWNERVVQGNAVTLVPKFRTRMIMAEKPSDGTAAFHYGDIDENDFIDAEDHLPTLPNTHFADLLADQFSSQIEHEGYVKDDDRIQLRPNRVNLQMGSQSSVAPDMQQYGEPIPGQSCNEIAKLASGNNASLNIPQNLVANARMLPPGNPQAMQMSQGLLSGVSIAQRPQQMDSQQLSVQQQQLQQNQHTLIQQQNPQFQRSLLSSNQLSHLNGVGQNTNMPLGNHLLNKATPQQLQQIQMLQQQHQQQMHQNQQTQNQRKMMMGVGTMGMGNFRNNLAGLSPMGNAMGIGAARGIGGTGISSPMTSIAGMGNIGQNPMNLGQASNITNSISQQYRPGTFSPAQAEILSKLRMVSNREAMLGSSQSNIAGLSGARQMHPSSANLSVLSQSLNRANMSPLQQRAMGPMGPPKLMPGMNLYMNRQQQQQQQQHQQSQQQQQFQLQQQQQHIQQQLQQQLQQQQQQETTSQLQTVISQPQVGSPSTMGVPSMSQQTHQQASPQQMSQRTPMSPQQMSSGAIHGMSTGNPEVLPASPQLSSQTLGSVGSITNSPMDMQGVNKSNSVNNPQ